MSESETKPTASSAEAAAAFDKLHSKSPEQVAAYLEGALPADAAAAMRLVSPDDAPKVIERLPPRTTALLMREMHPVSAAWLWTQLGSLRASQVLLEMAPDDRVDLLRHVPPHRRELALEEMGDAAANEVRRLASYPDESAGGLMTTEVIALPVTLTAEQAIAELRRTKREAKQVAYVYAVEPSGRLAGVLSMRDLIFAPPHQALGTIMRPGVVAVQADMDQEEVARVLRRHALLALPVVDRDMRLLGIIASDDLADVVEEEATEDIQKIGGTAALHAPYLEVGFGSMLRKRGGWLAILFLGEMLTATAMGFFEHQIQQAAMIALFVPLIISSGGNSGSQATTLIIRSLALREISLGDWWRITGRELKTGAVLGLLLGLIGALRIVLWYYLGWHDYGGHPYRMAATILLSLVGVVTFGTVIGSILPMIMHRLRLDPASASAPFVATLVDVTGLVIYFMVAIALLRGTVL